MIIILGHISFKDEILVGCAFVTSVHGDLLLFLAETVAVHMVVGEVKDFILRLELLVVEVVQVISHLVSGLSKWLVVEVVMDVSGGHWGGVRCHAYH